MYTVEYRLERSTRDGQFAIRSDKNAFNSLLQRYLTGVMDELSCNVLERNETYRYATRHIIMPVLIDETTYYSAAEIAEVAAGPSFAAEVPFGEQILLPIEPHAEAVEVLGAGYRLGGQRVFPAGIVAGWIPPLKPPIGVAVIPASKAGITQARCEASREGVPRPYGAPRDFTKRAEKRDPCLSIALRRCEFGSRPLFLSADEEGVAPSGAPSLPTFLARQESRSPPRRGGETAFDFKPLTLTLISALYWILA